MIEKLRAHYKDAIVIDEPTNHPERYEWFSSKNGEVIGIQKDRLTVKERELLSIFLTPLAQPSIWMNDEQRMWYRFLIQKDQEAFAKLPSSLYDRFIYFQIQKATVDQQDFTEALKGLFPPDVVIVWEDEHQVIVIEKKSEEENNFFSLSDLIDTLCSDFYIQLRAYIGQKCRHSPELLHLFAAEKRYFQLAAANIPKQKVYSIEDVFPLLLMKNFDLSYATYFLNDVKDDLQLLETVKTFFECNLNASLTAKKLYMHRNSLQYRIDKFIEKTGVDIKQFKGAIATYLAILYNEQNDF
ncbi:PucR family transcriptional regulator [Thermolongibacillus altinsuensis]